MPLETRVRIATVIAIDEFQRVVSYGDLSVARRLGFIATYGTCTLRLVYPADERHLLFLFSSLPISHLNSFRKFLGVRNWGDDMSSMSCRKSNSGPRFQNCLANHFTNN